MKKAENEYVKKYEIYLRLEQGLSPHTLEAYLTDLGKLCRFAENERTDVLQIRYADLQQFVAQLVDAGISPRSQARILSGVKSFYRFLMLEGLVQIDPTELMRGPKIGMKLPDVLTINDVNRIIDSIDLSAAFGHRNRAMLEVLYSCGLRVSELIGLACSDVYSDEEFIRVRGKGDKQRLVPISQTALREIRNYLPDRGMIRVKKGFEDTLFLNRRGKGLTRMMIFHIIRTQAALAGISKTVGPHTFRHSFATHLLEGGANLRAIQLMLGHEKITTTELYTHIDQAHLRMQIINHHPRNRKDATSSQT
jgi:integrase/recombinase XerD